MPADRCLAITFTRRAAGELTERLDRLLPRRARPLVTTFHGLGLRIVREHARRLGFGGGLRVADEAERLALAREAVGEAAGTARAREPRRLLDLVSRLALDPAAPQDPDLAGPLARYRAGKRARDLLDLDDLLALPVALLRADAELAAAYRDRWPHVSVDEYQDVDAAQYALLRLLCPPDGDLCAIGDPDQAIYSFRGADVGFFLRFGSDFPTARTVRLARNYRSTESILAAASSAVAPDTLVPGRELTAVAPGDGPDRVTVHAAADERAEAAFVLGAVERLLGGSDLTALLRGAADPWHDAVHSYADIAVLYRTDAQSRPLVDAFEAAGVPYQKRSHHRLGDQPGVRELLAVLRAELARAAGDPRPVLARVRAAAQTAIDAAGGLAAAGSGLTGGARAGRCRAGSVRSRSVRTGGPGWSPPPHGRRPRRTTRPIRRYGWRRSGRRSSCSPRWPTGPARTPTGSWPSSPSARRWTCGTRGRTGSRCSPCTRPRGWSSRWCSWSAARRSCCRCASVARPAPRTSPRSGGCSSSG